MFSGFNVKLDENTIGYDYFYEAGQAALQHNNAIIRENLQEYICNSDLLDGNLISNDWFPEIEADILLSHSHADENLVISFAGWLYEMFGLHTFIDSMVWGYSNDLLKIIDDEYCLKSSGSYSYEKRNYSTSHVHMMLSIALMKMIDKCESVFFVNTPNSIIVSENIVAANYTLSPWIYSEIEMTRMIRHKKLSEYRSIEKIINESVIHFAERKERLSIRYDIPLEHLVDLTDSDLVMWQARGRKNVCSIPMDKLYELKGILED